MKLTRIRSAITNVLLKEMENINNKITLNNSRTAALPAKETGILKRDFKYIDKYIEHLLTITKLSNSKKKAN